MGVYVSVCHCISVYMCDNVSVCLCVYAFLCVLVCLLVHVYACVNVSICLLARVCKNFCFLLYIDKLLAGKEFHAQWNATKGWPSFLYLFLLTAFIHTLKNNRYKKMQWMLANKKVWLRIKKNGNKTSKGRNKMRKNWKGRGDNKVSPSQPWCLDWSLSEKYRYMSLCKPFRRQRFWRWKWIRRILRWKNQRIYEWKKRFMKEEI